MSSTDKIVVAKSNMLRTSPIKLNGVARTIRNKHISKAILILEFSRKRIAHDVLKCLKSAVANAEQNNGLEIDNLFVKEAYVGKSMLMKRIRPRAKGRASSIKKMFSKLTIIVQERNIK